MIINKRINNTKQKQHKNTKQFKQQKHGSRKATQHNTQPAPSAVGKISRQHEDQEQ